MTGFIITKLVREHVAVETGAGGRSYGTLLDELMLTAAENKEEISLVEFEIAPEDWGLFVADKQPLSEAVEEYSSKFPGFKRGKPSASKY